MFYANNGYQLLANQELTKIYHQYQISDDKRPSGIHTALAEYLDVNWYVLFDKKAVDMLKSLTTHRKCEKIRNKFVAPSDYNRDKSASYQFNLFISNIRTYGLDAAFEHVNQKQLNRVRTSINNTSEMYHNHFGTSPEYVFEYEVYREQRAIVVRKIFSHESNDFTPKKSEIQRENDLSNFNSALTKAKAEILGKHRPGRKILERDLMADLHMNLNPQLAEEQKQNTQTKQQLAKNR